MEKVKIVFMGTPVFGKEILRCLVENGYDVVAAVTQPDKAVGRKQVITFSDVKQYALENNIEVIQPIKIRNDYQRILDINTDLIVTCAYGQIIPTTILDQPRLGCVNVHASLLPYGRGGAPIQHSIIDGLDQTGVTIMEMAAGMDSGDIISQSAVTIEDEDTYGSLHDKLIECGKQLLLETLPSIIEHSYTPIKQDEEKVTFSYNISKEDEHIDLTKPYKDVYNHIRGLIPQPAGYITVDGKKIKIHQVKMSEEVFEAENGTIVYQNKQMGLVIDNRLLLLEKVQMEGKNINTAREFINGAGRELSGKVAE